MLHRRNYFYVGLPYKQYLKNNIDKDSVIFYSKY